MFSAAFLIPKGSALHKQAEAAAVAALEAKFPGKGVAIRKSIEGNANKCCIQDGDATDYDGYEGHIAVRAKNKTRPTVLHADAVTPAVEADGIPYAGCYVNASIEFFGYDNTGKACSSPATAKLSAAVARPALTSSSRPRPARMPKISVNIRCASTKKVTSLPHPLEMAFRTRPRTPCFRPASSNPRTRREYVGHVGTQSHCRPLSPHQQRSPIMTFKLHSRVVFNTPRQPTVKRRGVVVDINETSRGLWYGIRPTGGGDIVKVRAANLSRA
jgi:hypothetical protein